jgi:hypothetical protein
VEPSASIFYSEAGGIRVIQNFETYTLNCIVFQLRRLQSSETDVSSHTLMPYLFAFTFKLNGYLCKSVFQKYSLCGINKEFLEIKNRVQSVVDTLMNFSCFIKLTDSKKVYEFGYE